MSQKPTGPRSASSWTCDIPFCWGSGGSLCSMQSQKRNSRVRPAQISKAPKQLPLGELICVADAPAEWGGRGRGGGRHKCFPDLVPPASPGLCGGGTGLTFYPSVSSGIAASTLAAVGLAVLGPGSESGTPFFLKV